MLIIPPQPFRKGRANARPSASTAPPINTIASVTIQSDHVTVDIFFTPGTTVTGVVNPEDNFFVNYSGGQTAGNATIVSPVQVRIVLVDVIDAPATWEVDDSGLFVFAEGAFGGPHDGDVGFA